MTPRSTLGITVYAPALVDKDGRALAVIHGMEQALPGLRLEWKVSEEGRPIALPQRDAWITEGLRDGGFPLVCNGNESYPVTVTGWRRPGRLSPGGHPLLNVHADLPLDETVTAVASNVLEVVAQGAHAFWGHATPFSAAVAIAEQTSPHVLKPGIPPRGLPALKRSEDVSAPEIPTRLGWLNYWSAAAARAIGFPDAARDADLLSRARSSATGGWVVQLTDAPLDLDNPTHLDALKRAYERFPEIGGRSPS